MLRYLKGTTDHGILFGRDNNATSEVLGYMDSDFAANLDKRRSFTGCIFTLYRRAMSWKASLLSVVALSTTEEEYIAFSVYCSHWGHKGGYMAQRFSLWTIGTKLSYN